MNACVKGARPSSPHHLLEDEQNSNQDHVIIFRPQDRLVDMSSVPEHWHALQKGGKRQTFLSFHSPPSSHGSCGRPDRSSTSVSNTISLPRTSPRSSHLFICRHYQHRSAAYNVLWSVHSKVSETAHKSSVFSGFCNCYVDSKKTINIPLFSRRVCHGAGLWESRGCICTIAHWAQGQAWH
jgi:hypothetical protein